MMEEKDLAIREKGSAMYFSLVVLTIILGLILSLSATLISQIRMVRGMEQSVVAFYAADSGIEEALFILKHHFPNFPAHSTTRTINLVGGAFATYRIRIDRGIDAPGGATGGCIRRHYCIRSEGDFRGIKRVIEVGN